MISLRAADLEALRGRLWTAGTVVAATSHARLVLPGTFRSTFTTEVASVFGVGLKTLLRLRAAGLAVRVGEAWRLVEPIDPARLALTAAGEPSALCSISAADRHGWALLHEPPFLHIAIPANRRPARWPNAKVHRWGVDTDKLVLLDGLRATAPLWTAVDVARTEPLDQSLVLLDSLLRDGVLDADALAAAVSEDVGRPGHLRAARAVRLADARRASPPESVFRALVEQAGLPAPVDQFEVMVGDRSVARADFAWPKQRLIVEIDGYAYHSAVGAFRKDRQRQNALVLGGWRVLRFTATDVLTQPTKVIAEVRRALEA